MSGPMRIRATNANGVTDVRVLMTHPMETGQRRGSDGNLVPGHYITEVTAEHNGKVVLQGVWGPGVSQNPFLGFKFAGGAKGEKLTVKWLDNKGETNSAEATIA